MAAAGSPPIRSRPVTLLVVALPLLAGVVACGGSSPAVSGQTRRPAGAAEPRAVQVTPAIEDTLVRTIAVTGTLAAEEQVTLSLKVTGRLNEMLVDLGSRVTKGQPIARLVPTDFRLREQQADAALAQARARLGLPPTGEDTTVDPERTAIVRQAKAVLEEARLTRDRTATFVKRGIAARADLDAAEAALQVADSRHQDALEEVRNRQALLEQRQSELELARQAVRDAQLTSPLDGVVRERHVTAGQYLAAGTPVVTIVRIHPLRLRVSIPERDAQDIRAGQLVRVRVEGDDRVYEGRVARISPAIDEASRTLAVEAEVPNRNGELRPGSFANVEVVTAASQRAIVVPASALVTFAGVDKVLVVEKGQASEKRVTTGRREGGRVEIVQGLSAGQSIIVQPGNLVQGDPVRITGSASGAPRSVEQR